MPVRLKKFIGLWILLIWLIFYGLLAANLGAVILPHANWLWEFVYYAFAGMAWIVPAGFLIQWMSEPPGIRR